MFFCFDLSACVLKEEFLNVCFRIVMKLLAPHNLVISFQYMHLVNAVIMFLISTKKPQRLFQNSNLAPANDLVIMFIGHLLKGES